MSARTLVSEIIEYFGLPDSPRDLPIPKSQVLNWMRADDVEALGALYAFVTKREYSNRIQPPLTFDDCWSFTARYFEKCLSDDPSGEWAHGRYDAGWDLASWFGRLWNDESIPIEAKSQIKAWLATQYKGGDTSLRRCLVDATLEHLFENREVARFFEDWKHDPELAVAFEEAADWSAKGSQTRRPR
jgi:hypothetical protein